jgi:hypothetical protein
MEAWTGTHRLTTTDVRRGHRQGGVGLRAKRCRADLHRLRNPLEPALREYLQTRQKGFRDNNLGDIIVAIRMVQPVLQRCIRRRAQS